MPEEWIRQAMRIPDSLVEKMLLDSGKASKDQIAKLRAQELSEKKPLQDLAIINKLLNERELTQLFAKEIDIPFIEFNAREISNNVLNLLPERVARQYRAIAFAKDDNDAVLIAMEDPDNLQALNFLRKQLGNNVKIHIAPASLLHSALEQYRGRISSELTQVVEVDDPEEYLAEDSTVDQTINLIIEYAALADASDIHIEPREKFIVIRYRIDGLLREVNKLPLKLLTPVIGRIKMLANLNIDERWTPQEGRFKVEIKKQPYIIRVSVLPVVDGEKIVMRIINESKKPMSFAELGFWGIGLSELNQAIVQPNGLILVSGPTGSGKSTTLFSILSSLNTPNVNISTVEDPVEYSITGANQTEIGRGSGLTFADGLSALISQDTNIIMVGEINDRKTAELAFQAALSGRLVLAGMHTKNAAACLGHLADMGIENYLVAGSVRAVIAQRLVRRLCPNCRQAIAPGPEILKQFKIKERLKTINKLEIQALREGLGRGSGTTNPANELSSTPSAITRIWQADDEGCSKCKHTGYRGRVGIYEVLPISESIQKGIVNKLSNEDRGQGAVHEGMLTLELDGIIKTLRGQTSIEEVLRVLS